MSANIDDRARRRVANWIAVSGITQAELGRRIGKNQAWMSRYLSGEHDADLVTLEKMAAVFGHSLIALLDVPADAAVTRLNDMFNALPSPSRSTVLRLLEDLTGTGRGGGRTPRKPGEP